MNVRIIENINSKIRPLKDMLNIDHAFFGGLSKALILNTNKDKK